MTKAVDPAELERSAAYFTDADPGDDLSTEARAELADRLITAAAEIRYWRANQALMIERAMRYVSASQTPATVADSIMNMLKPDLAAMAEVLEGNVHLGFCEPCGQPIKRGQLITHYNDVGDVHAECAGAEPDQMVAGGKIPLTLADLDLEEGEEPPKDPHLLVSVAEDFLNAERIVEIMNQANAVIMAYEAIVDAGEEEEA